MTRSTLPDRTAMTAPLDYRLEGRIATLALDDGKVNVMSNAMLAAIGAALERAQDEAKVVVIVGRSGIFSAGFDLGTLRAGGAPAREMLERGARLCERLLAYPLPVVAALTGPAMAMGAFLALSADVRLAVADTPFKIAANEVAIGLTLPRFAHAVLRYRLAPAHADRAAVTAQPYDARSALLAGWVDELVPAAGLAAAVQGAAAALAGLDAAAHAATKLRVREPVLQALRDGIPADVADWHGRV